MGRGSASPAPAPAPAAPKEADPSQEQMISGKSVQAPTEADFSGVAHTEPVDHGSAATPLATAVWSPINVVTGPPVAASSAAIPQQQSDGSALNSTSRPATAVHNPISAGTSMRSCAVHLPGVSSAPFNPASRTAVARPYSSVPKRSHVGAGPQRPRPRIGDDASMASMMSAESPAAPHTYSPMQHLSTNNASRASTLTPANTLSTLQPPMTSRVPTADLSRAEPVGIVSGDASLLNAASAMPSRTPVSAAPERAGPPTAEPSVEVATPPSSPMAPFNSPQPHATVEPTRPAPSLP
eukprot:TRINITY_DN14275_c0_g1_i1.p1 TRINITY_DN14275_c0_g1~~TRINITY_DN14275_c0_g1_i1.p1  ORF type:complete len:296 (+),score=52.56 TRINITY_DN14275_c0_g1_i1:340-1227(+)